VDLARIEDEADPLEDRLAVDGGVEVVESSAWLHLLGSVRASSWQSRRKIRLLFQQGRA
jgi:hypothetical protein